MRFIITGSGGCVCTPKPLCQCRVCVEARAKGRPYARCGCGFYLEDIALLADTPEDVAAALNNADIRSVDYIMYSHWDPDHTMGMRVVEQLRLEWLDFYENIKPENPIVVLASPGVMEDINGIRSKFGPLLDYYEHMGLIRRQETADVFEIGGVKITVVPVHIRKSVSVFVFESGGKRLVYAPCDCKPFPETDAIRGADVLVIGNTVIGETLKNGRALGPEHPLREELHTMEDVERIKEQLMIGRVVITHIEEDWGKSHDDYMALEKRYEGIQFAYDGMAIDL